MDYSQVAAEEHTGGSPWATSPQPNQTTFGPPSDSDEPTSPPPDSSQYNDTLGRREHDGDDTGPFGVHQGTHNGQGSNVQQPHEQPHEQPQRQQAPSQPQPQPQPQQHPTSQSRYKGRNPKIAQFKLSAKVTGLERTGRKDPIIRFDVATNLPRFRTTQFRDVRRTHAEFVKLTEHLISACPEALVPAVPSAITAAGAGTDEDEDRVKANIQRWLNVVCGNEVLIRDEEMVFFVESDFGYSPVVRRKQPATGVRRKVLKQFAPPPDETVELAEARPMVKMFYLETMSAAQKVDKVVKARKALGLSEQTLGLTLSQMSPQEGHPGLNQAFRKLGATIRAVGDYHMQQGTKENFTLGDPLTYHSNDAFIVKETLTNRQLLMRDLEQAQQTTRKRLKEADRIRASSAVRSDKVDEAIAALEEAKRTEEGLQKKVDDMTKNLVGEQKRWFGRTGHDLRAALREYVIRQIEAERRTLATLESVRPDIRAIDSTGGLSRLGREAHPKIRRSNLASSQGPKGDAWSGVSRRPDGVRRSESGGVSGLPVTEEGEEPTESDLNRKRSGSAKATGIKGLVEDDDEDRIDARNAASRLAQTTF